jgi:hypothetical protein
MRTITTRNGFCQFLPTIRRCHNRACERYRQPEWPAEEGAWALNSKTYPFLIRGLTETAALWSDVTQGYARVHCAAHVLSNDAQHTASQVRQTYETLLIEMK